MKIKKILIEATIGLPFNIILLLLSMLIFIAKSFRTLVSLFEKKEIIKKYSPGCQPAGWGEEINRLSILNS